MCHKAVAGLHGARAGGCLQGEQALGCLLPNEQLHGQQQSLFSDHVSPACGTAALALKGPKASLDLSPIK